MIQIEFDEVRATDGDGRPVAAAFSGCFEIDRLGAICAISLDTWDANARAFCGPRMDVDPEMDAGLFAFLEKIIGAECGGQIAEAIHDSYYARRETYADSLERMQ